MIPRGCTCKNTFPIPYAESDIKTICITYKQKDEVILEKTLEDCMFSEGHVSVKLSQEDTLKFDDKLGIIRIQIRVVLKNDSATKSNIMETYTDELLKEGVI